jgi:hypothetical protein
MSRLVIKGAIYTDGDMLLRPHYTGVFCMVDCTEYKTKKQMKEVYNKETVKQFLQNTCLEYDGEKYYECDYSPYHVDDDFVLLSDLDNLEYYDFETSF